MSVAVSHTRSVPQSGPVSVDLPEHACAHSPTLAVEMPITPPTPTMTKGSGAKKAIEEGEEETPTTSSSPSSSLSSSTPSISSSATTDSSITSDVNHRSVATSDQTSEDKDNQEKKEANGSAISTTTIMHAQHASVSAPSSASASSTSLSILLPAVSSSVSNIESGASSTTVPPPLSRRPPLNVRFAPLPEMAPRKRKSSVPLGMAARGQMARRRRAYMGGYDDDDYYDYPPPPPNNVQPTVVVPLTPAEMERRRELEKKREERAMRRAKMAAVEAAEALARAEAEEAAALEKGGDLKRNEVSLAKRVGSIWRKVASKESKGQKEGVGEVNEKVKGDEEGKAEPTATQSLGEEQVKQGGEAQDQNTKTSNPKDADVLDFEPPSHNLLHKTSSSFSTSNQPPSEGSAPSPPEGILLPPTTASPVPVP